MRAAIYARFSSDLQNPKSIDDQERLCRAHAGRIGADVVAVYADAAVSGFASANRPGYLAMLAAARAGAFEAVIVESLDRATRSGADTWDLYDEARLLGLRLETVGRGQVRAVDAGVHGMLGQIFLEDLGDKVRRGHAGVVHDGRLPFSPPYGYRRVRAYDAAGEPIRGLAEVDPATAPVVRRVFADFAAGLSGNAIARALNAEATPAAKGGLWDDQVVRQMVRNPLYAGQLVWGRSRSFKDRKTGRRRERAGPQDAQERHPVPALAIVSPEAWTAAQARHAAIAAAIGGRPELARRPRRLLSGIVHCAGCGRVMVLSGAAGGNPRYVCKTPLKFGPSACAAGRTAPAAALEARVTSALREALLHPDAVAAFVRERQAAQTRQDRARLGARADVEKQLAETIRRAERLVDQVAEGEVRGRAVAERLAALDADRTRLEAQLKAAPRAEVVRLHPGAAVRYRQLLENIGEALAAADTADRASAIADMRSLIGTVWIYPEPGRGNFRAQIRGDLGPMLSARSSVNAAGEGSAPPLTHLSVPLLLTA